MSKVHFYIGQLVVFLYHDKLRVGEVETVADTFVRLKTDEGFRSFSYAKIKKV